MDTTQDAILATLIEIKEILQSLAEKIDSTQ